MIYTQKLAYLFRVTSKAKIYKKPLYEAIPHFHKPHYIDIHEGYKKRSKEEVLADLRSLEIDVMINRQVYQPSDPTSPLKNRKAVIELPVQSLKLTHLQQQRFKLLVGPRYNPQTGILKMACEMFTTYEQNIEKVFEQLEEVLLETKRAP